jgi:uncharacterized protein (DUF2141 family)
MTRQSSQPRPIFARGSLGKLIFCGILISSNLVIAPKALAAGTISGQVFNDTNTDGVLDTGELGISDITIILRNPTTNTCQSVKTNSTGNYSFASVSNGNYEIIEAANQSTPTPSTCSSIGSDPINYASTTSNIRTISVNNSNRSNQNFGDHLAKKFDSCPAPAYMIQGSSSSTLRLYELNLATGVLTDISGADLNHPVNAIGMNLEDGFIYGINKNDTTNTRGLVRVDLDGKSYALGGGIDGLFGSVLGDVVGGRLYTYSTTSNGVTKRIQILDVNPNSPTFRTLLDTINITGDNDFTASRGLNDIAFNPVDKAFYGVSRDTGKVVKITLTPSPDSGSLPTTAVGEETDIVAGQHPNTGATLTGAFGATFYAVDGTFYAYRNNNYPSAPGTGAIFSLKPLATPTPTAGTLFATGPGVSQNDGARCYNAPAISQIFYQVTGTLYQDSNNNGVNDSEPALGPNVKVTIYNDENANNQIDLNEELSNTLTDTSGNYTLSNVPNGTYKIKIDTSDPDIGEFNLATANDLSITINSASVGNVNFGFSAITYTISGKVFEDVNYGGGAGRNFTVASGVGRTNARVELYNASGNFVSFTTTNATGDYSFSGLAAGNYTVRVVNSSVTSSRLSSATGVLPVQTYRTIASTGTAIADPNAVGGQTPNLVDADNGSTTLVALATSTTTSQSITPVTIGSVNVTGVDFGFNFDTIVNTNNSGQGSLSQFITNSNALPNSTLDQVANSSPAPGTTAIDPAAGDETSIFMIPVGWLTNGVAEINITTLLPTITGANANNTIIDGRTQTVNLGNTNNITLGTGGTVGVDSLPLSQVNGPEVQIKGLTTLTAGLNLQADNIRVQGIAIYGFARTMQSDANININSSADNTVITGNVIGTTARSFTDVGASNRTGSYGIFTNSATGTFSNNLIGYNGRGGIEVILAGTNTVLIENNEIRGNAILDSRAEGTNMGNGGGVTVRGNLFADHGGPGIDTDGSTGSNTYVNNTVTNNGLNLTGQSNPQTSGIRIQGTNNLIDHNVIYNNVGAGILVRDVGSTTRITQNSIYGNGLTSNQIGIDLVANGGNGDSGTSIYVTLNDGTTTASSGNGLIDFPVFTNATIVGSNLILSGYARPSAAIELFIAEPDPSGFGEGKTYLTTVTEGTAADTDTTTGSYSGAIAGLNSGSDSNANKFKFTIPLSSLPGVIAGTRLTATTTLANSTSEFSGWITVTGNPNLAIVKRLTAVNPGTTGAQSFATVFENHSSTADDHAYWPSGYLAGKINHEGVWPGDELEYTIYFLSSGDKAIANVDICDVIPEHTTYVPNSMRLRFGSDSAETGLTDSADSDAGQLHNNGTTAPCPQVQAATRSVAVVNLAGTASPLPPATAAGSPGRAYGYVRFRVKVN